MTGTKSEGRGCHGQNDDVVVVRSGISLAGREGVDKAIERAAEAGFENVALGANRVGQAPIEQGEIGYAIGIGINQDRDVRQFVLRAGPLRRNSNAEEDGAVGDLSL